MVVHEATGTFQECLISRAERGGRGWNKAEHFIAMSSFTRHFRASKVDLQSALERAALPPRCAFVLSGFLAGPRFVKGVPDKRRPAQMSILRIVVEVLAEHVFQLLCVDVGREANIAANRVFEKPHRLNVRCAGCFCSSVEIYNVIAALIDPSRNIRDYLVVVPCAAKFVDKVAVRRLHCARR